MVPSQKVPGGESGQYHVWDAEGWCKERRDMVVMYGELEEKGGGAATGVSGMSPGLGASYAGNAVGTVGVQAPSVRVM